MTQAHDSDTEFWLIPGIGKTGSTYLQKCLSASRSRLQAAGVTYPEAPNEVYSGNGAHLFEQPLPAHSSGRYLYCNEHMWHHMLDAEDLEMQIAALGAPRLLIFVRDPLEHAASAWNQDLKRGRYSNDNMAAFFTQYSIPTLLRRLLERLETTPAQITLRNYSKRQGDPVNEVEAWLGVSGLVKGGTSNRSLTMSETNMLLDLTTAGYPIDGLADAFRRALPEAKTVLFGPPLEAQKRMLDRLAEDTAWLDDRLGDQRFGYAWLPEFDRSEMQITQGHLIALADHFSRHGKPPAQPGIVRLLRRFLTSRLRG